MARISVLLVAVLISLQGCSAKDGVLGPAPERHVVGSQGVPGPGPGIYFNFALGHSDDPRPLLAAVVDAGNEVIGAWLPQYVSPCAAMGAAEALVIQVVGESHDLEGFGFVSDPEPWIPNCGIRSFWEYAVAR